MTLRGKTLTEVAAIVSTHLAARGIDVAVVGGSAITSHVPDVYTSLDIDFAVISGINHHAIARALRELGFKTVGRSFAHPETPYTVDIVADTPFIDRRPVQDFAIIETSVGTVRVYHIEDAIADRIAAFLHWSDSESLDVAERSARAARNRISQKRLEAALGALEPVDAASRARMAIARDRLAAALRPELSPPTL